MRKLLIAFLLIFLTLSIAQSSVAAEAPKDSVVYEIEKSYELNVSGPGDVKDLKFRFYLLDNRNGWADQKIISEDIDTTAGSLSVSSTEDNRYVDVYFETIEGGTTETVSLGQTVKVNSVDSRISSENVQGPIPESLESKYTEPVEGLWQVDHPDIQAKAQELTSDVSNYYLKAQQILEWVENHLNYEAQTVEHDALWAYEHNEADCSGYSNLFIALARAAGVPAKTVSGYLPFTELYGKQSNDLSRVAHQWVIIYLPPVGWTSVDLTYNPPKGQFGKLSEDHVIELISDGSNWVDNSEIQIPSWKYFPAKCVGGDCSIEVNRTKDKVSRVVAVEPSITTSDEIIEDKWEFTVEVKNVGSQDVSNIRVRLKADNKYFETPPPKELDPLATGTQGYAHFDVTVKESVENSPVTAVVTYDAGEYGSFKSKSKVYTSVELTEEIYDFPISWKVIMIASALVILAAVGGAILLRR